MKRWMRITLLTLAGIGLAAAATVAGLAVSYRYQHSHDRLVIGASFSADYARQLGEDPRQTYQALLDQLHLRHLRLMSYWNDIEPSPGQYDFGELDWQMQQAASHGAGVSLAIGQRQPRWPECHIPGWASSLGTDSRQYNQALHDFLTTVVRRYRNNPALRSWQLENEASNGAFGSCPAYDPHQLAGELSLVKQLDPRHPADTTVGDQYGLPVTGPRGDQIGLSVYRKVYTSTKLYTGYLVYPMPAWWITVRAAVIQDFLHRPVFIHELQAEPWGPGKAVQDMSLAEQDKTMNARQLVDNVQYARSTGIHTIYLWGAEWWYWRLRHGDRSVWQAAAQVIGWQS